MKGQSDCPFTFIMIIILYFIIGYVLAYFCIEDSMNDSSDEFHELTQEEKVVAIIIMIIFWLPIVIYGFYLFLTDDK